MGLDSLEMHYVITTHNGEEEAVLARKTLTHLPGLETILSWLSIEVNHARIGVAPPLQQRRRQQYAQIKAFTTRVGRDAQHYERHTPGRIENKRHNHYYHLFGNSVQHCSGVHPQLISSSDIGYLGDEAADYREPKGRITCFYVLDYIR